MKLYHATHANNLESIWTHGLLVSACDTNARIKAVWLHTRTQSPWAILHTQRRHKVALEDVLVVEVEVPRTWLKRFKTGLWYASRDIPPSKLKRAIWGEAYAQSAK